MAFKESIILKIIFPLAEKIIGTCTLQWYERIAQMNHWSKEEVLTWQESELEKFVHHAYHHTKYYRRVFDDLGLKPDDIKTFKDLKKLPIITKDIVRSHYDELVPDNLDQYKYRYGVTGGTTGEPMKYICDENVWGYVTAAKIFYWKTTGYHYGDKFAALGSASILSQKPTFVRRVYDIMRGEIAMNSMGIDDSICDKYISTIKKKHIHFIYGYASSIFVFAKYVAENSIDMSIIRGVFTTSENLTDNYRETIESAFGCKVMDCYGAKDAGITAYEVARNKYNVGYNAITEIENGIVLTTNLINYCFPLIRYDFGDCAEFAMDCGTYNGQVISNIYGRKSNIIRLTNGIILTAPGFTVLMPKFDIKAFQIVQISGDKIILKIQPINKKLDNFQEDILLLEMQKYIGEDCNIEIEYIDSFEPLKNGKRTYFIV